jgi:hypothetical protein
MYVGQACSFRNTLCYSGRIASCQSWDRPAVSETRCVTQVASPRVRVEANSSSRVIMLTDWTRCLLRSIRRLSPVSV